MHIGMNVKVYAGEGCYLHKLLESSYVYIKLILWLARWNVEEMLLELLLQRRSCYGPTTILENVSFWMFFVAVLGWSTFSFPLTWFSCISSRIFPELELWVGSDLSKKLRNASIESQCWISLPLQRGDIGIDFGILTKQQFKSSAPLSFNCWSKMWVFLEKINLNQQQVATSLDLLSFTFSKLSLKWTEI